MASIRLDNTIGFLYSMVTGLWGEGNIVDKISILIADDHPGFREGLCRLLGDEEDFEIIAKAGGSIVADTCMVVSPIEKMGYKTTGVNSGKAANYLPGFCKQEVCFSNIDDLLEEIA